ncbi:hypothetical protein [Streptomyces sp. NPDC046925]|uniref:hypothetical protein n=1 Tax=Streptomyces sp. NPDC046925 TaxID=3155375 RepID=UPI0033D97990
MPRNTFTQAVAAGISRTDDDIKQLADITVDQLIAACDVRAQLSTALALLDVADAIRGVGGASVERAMERMTDAVRDAGRRRG